MSDAIHRFFQAWGDSDPDTRAATLRETLCEDITYLDPRTPEALTSVAALIDYVAMYSAQAPGATARVAHLSTTGAHHRATVEFAMPNGMTQHGQYFIDLDNQSRLKRLIGFVGLGEPE